MKRKTDISERRVGYRLVRNRRELEALTAAEREARARALEAVSEVRRRGLSLSAASREAGTTLPTVLRYAHPAIERRGRRHVVKPSDRLYRRLRMISTDGSIEIDTHSSRQAELISAHANAVQAYGLSGDERLLAPFEGRRVHIYLFETRPEALALLAAAGELSPFELYPESE